MDVLLNSRLGPELLRILVTGSLFALGMLFGWLLGILRWRRLPLGPPIFVPLVDADEMVDAALAGLDMGEVVTIPSLPDMAEWSRFNDARLAMGPNLSLAHAARRYHRAGEAA